MLKLIDFGLSANKDTNLRQTGQIFGTPYYLSPEMTEARGEANK